MNFSKHKLYAVFVLLVLVTLTYILLVYEVPQNVQRLLFVSKKDTSEKSDKSVKMDNGRQISTLKSKLFNFADTNYVPKGLSYHKSSKLSGNLRHRFLRPITTSSSSKYERQNDDDIFDQLTTSSSSPIQTNFESLYHGMKKDLHTKAVQDMLSSPTPNQSPSNKNMLDKTSLDMEDNEAPNNKKSSMNQTEGYIGELKKRLPNVIIIGSKKGGTRALLKFLSVHPNVKISYSEVHFFDKHYDRGIEWYIEQMPETYPGQITMEKTPGYFVRPQVPERLSRLCKERSINMKFLVIVRDPVIRAISDYTQGLYQHKTMEKNAGDIKHSYKSLESKVFSNVKRRTVKKRNTLIYTGLYSIHLKRWLKYFNLKNFHFISGEQLIKKPWEELYAVQKFLNISVTITKEHFWYNKTKQFYCLKLKRIQNTVVEKSPKCFGDNKGRKHPFIDPATISALRKFFKRFNNKFYKMVGRNFGW